MFGDATTCGSVVLIPGPNRAEFVLYEQVFGRSSDRESGKTTGIIRAVIVNLEAHLEKRINLET